MNKMLSYGCATWLLSLGAVQAQPANVTTAATTLVAPAAAMKPAEARPPIWESQPVANQPLVPQALQMNNPTVLTTARLQDGDRVVTLNGIEGLDGDAAQGLRTYLSGQHLACQAVDNDGFNCTLPDGTNVAEAALINGAARAKPDASNAYREDEAQAQAARWAEATGAALAIWRWAEAAEPAWVAHRSWDVLAAASTSHPCGWVAPGAGGREKVSQVEPASTRPLGTDGVRQCDSDCSRDRCRTTGGHTGAVSCGII